MRRGLARKQERKQDHQAGGAHPVGPQRLAAPGYWWGYYKRQRDEAGDATSLPAQRSRGNSPAITTLILRTASFLHKSR